MFAGDTYVGDFQKDKLNGQGTYNFANGDMVGHTGDLKATVDAMQVLDDCLEQLLIAIDEVGGVLVFTADHGNADIMYTEHADGEVTPKTSHTLSPVPFVIHDATGSGEYRLTQLAQAGLANVAATVLNLMGYDAPEGYEPSLIEFADDVPLGAVSFTIG